MLEGKPLLVVVGGSDTGRTPMIAGLVRAVLGEEAQVRTAGVLAHSGEGATPEAQMALEQLGLDIRDHRAQPFAPEQRRHADLLLAVDRGTALVLHSQFAHDERVVCLSALCDQPDVLDPHRMPLGVWIATGRQLQAQVAQALPAIRQRLNLTDVVPAATSDSERVLSTLAAPDDHATDTVSQMCRLLVTAETLPMIVDWSRVRYELVAGLRALASTSSDPDDLLPAAVLMIEGTLTYFSTQPPAEVLQRLRQVIERLGAPVDSTSLVAIGALLHSASISL
jgi:protein-tyrosine phosphatase